VSHCVRDKRKIFLQEEVAGTGIETIGLIEEETETGTGSVANLDLGRMDVTVTGIETENETEIEIGEEEEEEETKRRRKRIGGKGLNPVQDPPSEKEDHAQGVKTRSERKRIRNETGALGPGRSQRTRKESHIRNPLLRNHQRKALKNLHHLALEQRHQSHSHHLQLRQREPRQFLKKSRVKYRCMRDA